MVVDVFFSAAAADPAALVGRTVVVIDVLRASSTIVESLGNGAGEICPTPEAEEALKLASSLGRTTNGTRALPVARGALLVGGRRLRGTPAGAPGERHCGGLLERRGSSSRGPGRFGAMNTDLLSSTVAGRRLRALGFAEDLELCAQVDRHAIVPEMRDRVITVG